MTRQAIVAGQFYPGRRDELVRQISGCFTSEFGPGALPGKRGTRLVRGVIVPHAGYSFSGPCAAWAYKSLAESKKPDTYILLGLSHQGYGSAISIEDWETPLGLVKADKELAKSISESSGIPIDGKPHQAEHSIEVQLPFLQFIDKDARIVPIIISEEVDHIKAAKNIAETIEECKKRVVVIASSDFTHFGANYGYFPFSDNVKENMYKLDEGAIKHILSLNSKGFLDYVDKTCATICGRLPIALGIDICKILGGNSGKLLKYYTSGDVIDDYSSAVGYGAIVIE